MTEWLLYGLAGARGVYLLAVLAVAGQLDDAILVAFVLRRVVRRTDPELIRELWPGPEAGLRLVLCLSGACP